MKCVSDGKGPQFYRDHLPLLGEISSIKQATKWQVADYVKVDLELEVVRSLQFGHGGWAYGMEEVNKLYFGIWNLEFSIAIFFLSFLIIIRHIRFIYFSF